MKVDPPSSAATSMKVLRLLPEVVMTAPERIFLKFAVILVGIGVLANANNPKHPLSQIPTWVVFELSLTLIIGGTAALIGIVLQKRPAERFGLAATAFGSASYALTLALHLGFPQAASSVVIFAGLAVASGVRLLVSSAASRVMIATLRISQENDE